MAILLEPGRGKPTVVVTEELLEKVLKDVYLNRRIDDIRSKLKQAEEIRVTDAKKAKALEKEAGRIKSTLPGWIFSSKEMVAHEWVDSKKVSRGVAAWRHQDWCRVNGLIMCDFDHIENPREVFEEKISPLIKQGYPIYMVYISPSGHGLKVVFMADANIGDIADNQRAFAEKTGLEVDEVCFDASRLSFCTGDADVLYINVKGLLNDENEAFIEKYTSKYYKGNQEVDMFGGNSVTVPAPADAAGNSGDNDGSVQPAAVEAVDDFSSYSYEGIAIPEIINKLLPPDGVKEGKRHDTLFQLCKQLRYVCERSQKKVAFFVKQLDWVKVLDEEDGNVDRTIADAMAKPYSSYKPKTLTRALNELGYTTEREGIPDFSEYVRWGERLQALQDKFPCLSEIAYGRETGMIPSALFVSAAFFGTLMTRTWWYHWFEPKERRRLNYCVIVIGDPGSGKSFVGNLFKTIMEPIIVSDKMGNDAINAYNDAIRNRDNMAEKEKSKESAPKYPDVKIRIHGARTANGVFIEHMNKCVETINGEPFHLHMFTFSAELDAITAANKGGQWIDKTNMELLAFHNEMDNQQYRNRDSYSGPFNVYWNFVYTGTPVSLAKKVNERNFGTGLFGRLGCLPIAGNYFECAPERKETKEEQKAIATLKKWAYELDKVQGELPLAAVVHETYRYTKEVMAAAELDGNKADAFLVRRVPYYGVNVSAPFILMRHWKEWQEKRTFTCDKYDIELCRIAMEIQMHSQRYFFGRYAEIYFDNTQRENLEKRMHNYGEKSKGYFNALTEQFNIDDVQTNCGLSMNAARVLVSRWCKDGVVKKLPGKRGQEKWKKTRLAL